MKTLTAKLLNDKLKKGWTAKEFADHLKCSEDEFWIAMGKNFYGNAYKNIAAQLKKNDKNRSRAVKKVYSRIEKIDTSKYLEESEYSDIEGTTDTTPIEERSEPETIETLTNKKNELAKSISERLSKRDEHKATKTTLENQLALSNEELVKLLDRIEVCKASVESIKRKIDAEEKQIEQDNVSIQLYESQLSEVHNKIETLRKVTVFVYNSGEIAISSEADTNSNTIWAEEFDTLVKNDTLECLTVKQLKALAQVICLARDLKAQNRQYEIAFENQLSEEFFEEVVN